MFDVQCTSLLEKDRQEESVQADKKRDAKIRIETRKGCLQRVRS